MWEHDSPAAILRTILAPGFSLYDQWEAQLLAMILLKARVGLFSSIPPADVRRAHLEPVGRHRPRVCRKNCGGSGRCAPVAVIPEGPMTIPYLQPRD